MFYYVDQLRTTLFPIGLVKTESVLIVGSVETDVERSMLVVAVVMLMAVLMHILFWLSQA